MDIFDFVSKTLVTILQDCSTAFLFVIFHYSAGTFFPISLNCHCSAMGKKGKRDEVYSVVTH